MSAPFVMHPMGCNVEASYSVSGGWVVTRLREFRNGILSVESCGVRKLGSGETVAP
ncbi:MAG: hypothetical protein ACYDDF_06775 [Thermoplasmatota archaeon]